MAFHARQSAIRTLVWVVGGCFVTISDTSALVWRSAMGGFGVWGLGFGVWGLGFGVWGLGCLTTWDHPSGQDFGVAGRLRMTYDLRGKGPHNPRPAWPPWRLEDKMTETNSSTSRTSLPGTFSLPVNENRRCGGQLGAIHPQSAEKTLRGRPARRPSAHHIALKGASPAPHPGQPAPRLPNDPSGNRRFVGRAHMDGGAQSTMGRGGFPLPAA